MFIEEAVQGYSSCLIASTSNRCNTVVCGLVYLMMKYKWNLHRALEYLNGRKPDIEVTKMILKQLQQLERLIEKDLQSRDLYSKLRSNWNLSHTLETNNVSDVESDSDYSRLGHQEYIQLPLKRRDTNTTKNSGNIYMRSTYIQIEDEAAIIN